MAIVNIRNATVTRLNGRGTGFGIKESNESNGKEYVTYWTVWAQQDSGVQVGDVVNVSGFLSTKVGEPKTGTDGIERRYVEHSLNSPRIERVGANASQQPQQARTAPNTPDARPSANDVWNAPQNGAHDLEPF